MKPLYDYRPHPHTVKRQPIRSREHVAGRFGERLGLKITALVGTMACGYTFGLIALVSLPSAVTSHNLTVLIAWVSSNFLQLVLLPIIIVGQNLQAKTSDARSEQTFSDVEALMHGQAETERHLAAQDELLQVLAAGGSRLEVR